MAFTEFFCDQTNGSNLNGGSLNSSNATTVPAAATVFTYTSGTWVGGGTRTFTATGGTTSVGSIGAVTNGDWACVYTNGATAASAGIWARITVSGSVITLNATATIGSGTVSTTANAATIAVGGRWKGPTTTEIFPFGTITNVAINTSSYIPRVNFLTGTYTGPTSTLWNHSAVGPTIFQGYATLPGDLYNNPAGRPTFVFPGTPGTAWILLGGTSVNSALIDIIFSAGSSPGGSIPAIYMNATGNLAMRCTVNNSRTAGIKLATFNAAVECEVNAANQANVANTGGIQFDSSGKAIRCYVHDTANSGHGFTVASSPYDPIIVECVADTCGGAGIYATTLTTNGTFYIKNCTLYNNASHQINIQMSSKTIYMDNNVIIGNGGSFWGVNFSDTTNVIIARNTHFQNNGSGTWQTTNNLWSEGETTWGTSINLLNSPAAGSFGPLVLMGPGTNGVVTGSPAFPATSGTNSTYATAGAIQPNRVVVNN